MKSERFFLEIFVLENRQIYFRFTTVYLWEYENNAELFISGIQEINYLKPGLFFYYYILHSD